MYKTDREDKALEPVSIYKDAMVAVMGATVALGGLLLVFVGAMFAQAAVMRGQDNSPADVFKNVGRVGLVPFTLSLVTAMLSTGYFLKPCDGFALASMILFLICLTLSIAYGLIATRFL